MSLTSSGLLTASLGPIARKWRRAVDATLMPFGLSEANAAPLVHISRSGGGMTQTELADLIGIGGPGLVRILDSLVGAGLVDRYPDPDDKRLKRLKLTPRGAELVGQVEQAVDDLRASIVSGPGAAQIEACIAVIGHMSNALDARHRRSVSTPVP